MHLMGGWNHFQISFLRYNIEFDTKQSLTEFGKLIVVDYKNKLAVSVDTFSEGVHFFNIEKSLYEKAVTDLEKNRYFERI